MEIKFVKSDVLKEKPESSTLGFGKFFTDYMFMMDYSREEGWHDARIIPFAPIALHPASTVLHYGSEIFEGLKAYRCKDGSVQLFRPMENIRRMNTSADRLCLPEIPEDLALEVLTEFVKLEQDWTPSAEGQEEQGPARLCGERARPPLLPETLTELPPPEVTSLPWPPSDSHSLGGCRT